jgi:tRNA-guanine transglycosylase
MERTHRWAERSLAAHGDQHPQALLGIVQGGAFPDLRVESTRVIASMPFDGIAIGGSLGESKADMHQVLDWTVPLLPDEKFRHLLGIGDVDDLFEGVERGIDSFDCVIPTRFARHGTLFVEREYATKRRFRLNINNARYAEDRLPINPGCDCPACRTYSRAYLHHLFRAGEILGIRLASLHNIWFMQRLMRNIRRAIQEGTFAQLKRQWME